MKRFFEIALVCTLWAMLLAAFITCALHAVTLESVVAAGLLFAILGVILTSFML